MTTVDFITALFCQVANQMPGIPKHPQASLWPSEVVPLGLLHALKGVGNPPFYRWLVAQGCFDNTHMQELGGRFLKLAGTDVVSDSQPVDV